jgi:hypothetical protein
MIYFLWFESDELDEKVNKQIFNNGNDVHRNKNIKNEIKKIKL